MSGFAISAVHNSAIERVKISILTSPVAVRAVMRQWRRNYRERRDLASMSARDRYELGFIGDVDAEIAKPFWRG